jgi:hypothetical protein
MLMIRTLLLFSLLAGLGYSQSVSINEDSRLETTSTPGVFKFTWQGKAARTYFIQNSQDLQSWATLPVIEVGADQRIEYGFTITTTRFFFRLRFSDLPAADVRTADFDGDGISNWDEIQQELDPLKPDTDGDGMDDGYELANGLNPNLADGSGDLDSDGVTNDEDARPNNASIGRLEVTITSPMQGDIL